jgi:hypothetical protein
MKKILKNKKRPKKKIQKKQTWEGLKKATAAYFGSLSAEAVEEENQIGAAMAWASSQVNFDG